MEKAGHLVGVVAGHPSLAIRFFDACVREGRGLSSKTRLEMMDEWMPGLLNLKKTGEEEAMVALSRTVIQLKDNGAQAVALVGDLSPSLLRRLRFVFSIPIFALSDFAVEQISLAHPRPNRVGLLTPLEAQAEFYCSILAPAGIDGVRLPATLAAELGKVVADYEGFQGTGKERVCRWVMASLDYFIGAGVELVLVASKHIPPLEIRSGSLPFPLFQPIERLAKAMICQLLEQTPADLPETSRSLERTD
ncbi:hypothetical protein HY628_01720 [Candidatus Uhrbacteria bacterium]|nr:hypothetical protein [Candidatus Uhrbacteria bacterium]